MSDMDIDGDLDSEDMNIEENNNNNSSNTYFLPHTTQIDSVILETKPKHTHVSSYDFSKPLSATAGIRNKYIFRSKMGKNKKSRKKPYNKHSNHKVRKKDAQISNPSKDLNSNINETEPPQPPVASSDIDVVEPSQPPVFSTLSVASSYINVVEPSQPPVASSDVDVVEPSQTPVASLPSVASSDINLVQPPVASYDIDVVDTSPTFVPNSEDHNLKPSPLVTNSNNDVDTSPTFASNSEDDDLNPPQPTYITEDVLFKKRINQVEKEYLKGNECPLLGSPPTKNQSLDQCKETNVGTTDEIFDHISPNQQPGETTNEISNSDAVSPSTNYAKSSTCVMGNIFSSPQIHPMPVFGRIRKKTKFEQSEFGWGIQANDNQKIVEPTPCNLGSKNELGNKPKASDNVQNVVNLQKSKNDHGGAEGSLSQELIVTSTCIVGINKDSDLDTKRVQQDDQIKSSKECKCQPILSGIWGMGFYTCHCDASKYQLENIDFDNIMKEEIPDTTKPIPAAKSKRFSLPSFLAPLGSLFGYEDFGHDKTKHDHKPGNPSKWDNKSNPDLSSLDPLAPQDSNDYSRQHTSTNSSTNLNPHTFGTNSQNVRSYASVSQSASSSQNFSWSDNNNHYGSSLTRSNSNHKTSFLPPKAVRLLLLSISFDTNEQPNLEKGHSTYHHPIFHRFKSPRIDTENALNFIHDCIINCWANSWRVALVVSINPKEDPECLYHFFKKFRSMFESEILSIIFIRPACPMYFVRNFNDLGVAVARGSHGGEGWKQDLSNLIHKVITKAYRPNKYGRDDILFYNKDEPYYEFTNFYRAKIFIDHVDWPTTEHYFQAAKFQENFIRDKIRFAYTAREAFTIARSHNSFKREDWEMPKPPDDVIFKETIMKHALFMKFTQHVKLKYMLLSTGKAKIYEHTENDRYWGDGGRHGGGLNRLGTMLVETRTLLMENEKSLLIQKYNSQSSERWIVSELKVLREYDDLINFDP
ncbi:5746_t:CDS:2 [Funneliformis geosporum]|uniref:5746_t:CDS:1 n=1 Tax=Funneliformis geosporum TaxID=1117311 RepID=A0A9W4T2E0_9GLOM|nr:5746_t:CDS:2 [Funneliformis geosporum]